VHGDIAIIHNNISLGSTQELCHVNCWVTQWIRHRVLNPIEVVKVALRRPTELVMCLAPIVKIYRWAIAMKRNQRKVLALVETETVKTITLSQGV